MSRFTAVVRARIPDRLAWAVQALDISPGDRILEIGCGNGAAVSLVCDRLAGGRITAIDRSATAIDRATRRNAAHVSSGKAVFQHTDLAGFAPSGQRFDTVYAVNVNAFWVAAAEAEWGTASDVLRPAGVLHLFYQTPTEAQLRRVAEIVTAAMTDHGFSPATIVNRSLRLLHITGRLGHHTR